MTTIKATLYLDSNMYKTFKMRAVQSGQSVSALMNDAMKAQLNEDLEDINAIRERIAANEKPISYESALQDLKERGLL